MVFCRSSKKELKMIMKEKNLTSDVNPKSSKLSTILYALAVLTLSSTTWAQTPPASEPNAASALESMRGRAAVGSPERLAPQAMAKKMHERGMHHFEKNQAELKKQLNLTPAQEPLWETFVLTMRPSAPEGHPLERAHMKEISQLPAPQRAQKMLEWHESRHEKKLAQMKTHLEAMNVFYAQLSAEQQKTFDQVTWKHHQEMRRWGPGAGMHRPA
jgi:periplasmic protein CpxP/Spy